MSIVGGKGTEGISCIKIRGFQLRVRFTQQEHTVSQGGRGLGDKIPQEHGHTQLCLPLCFSFQVVL